VCDYGSSAIASELKLFHKTVVSEPWHACRKNRFIIYQCSNIEFSKILVACK